MSQKGKHEDDLVALIRSEVGVDPRDEAITLNTVREWGARENRLAVAEGLWLLGQQRRMKDEARFTAWLEEEYHRSPRTGYDRIRVTIYLSGLCTTVQKEKLTLAWRELRDDAPPVRPCRKRKPNRSPTDPSKGTDGLSGAATGRLVVAPHEPTPREILRPAMFDAVKLLARESHPKSCIADDAIVEAIAELSAEADRLVQVALGAYDWTWGNDAA